MQRLRVGWVVVAVFAVFLLLGAAQQGTVEGRFRLVNYQPGGGPERIWAPVMMIDSHEGKTWIMGYIKGSKATPLWVPVVIQGKK